MTIYNNGSNDYAVSQFLVAKTAGQGNYLTIQSAINAANAIATSSNPQVVWIKPGLFTENLTLHPYVSLAGTGAGINSQIIGNAIYNGTGAWSASNVSFISNNSSAALSLQGTDIADINLNFVDFNSGSSSGIAFECTGSGITATMLGCSLEAAAGGRCKNITAGAVQFFNSVSQFTDTASTIAGTGSLTINSSTVGDAFVVSSADASITLFGTTVNSGSLGCIAMTGGLAIVLDTAMQSSVTFLVAGTGTLLFSDIHALQFGSSIDPGITIVPLTNLSGPINLYGNLTFNPSTKGIVGTTTNNNTSAGNVGEYISSSVLVGSQVPLSNSTSANITSISLTAGDWDVRANIIFNPAAGTLMSEIVGCINTTSATFPTAGAENNLIGLNLAFTAGMPATQAIGPTRISLASTTTVYLIALCDFTVSTCGGYGFIGARRIR
jgi:hypothetical protein